MTSRLFVAIVAVGTSLVGCAEDTSSTNSTSAAGASAEARAGSAGSAGSTVEAGGNAGQGWSRARCRQGCAT